MNRKETWQFAKATHRPILLVSAIDRSKKHELTRDQKKRSVAQTDSDTTGLPSVLGLVVGQYLVLKRNLCTAMNLCNGSRGIVERVVLHQDEPDPPTTCTNDASRVHRLKYLPKCIIMSFPGCKIRGLRGLPDGHVPIWPEKKSVRIHGPRGMSELSFNITRTQFPLLAARAMTAYAAQGRTMDRLIVDLRKPPGRSPQAASYVMLSRVKSLAGLCLLHPVSLKDLKQAPHPDLEAELEHLGRQAELTERVFRGEVDINNDELHPIMVSQHKTRTQPIEVRKFLCQGKGPPTCVKYNCMCQVAMYRPMHMVDREPLQGPRYVYGSSGLDCALIALYYAWHDEWAKSIGSAHLGAVMQLIWAARRSHGEIHGKSATSQLGECRRAALRLCRANFMKMAKSDLIGDIPRSGLLSKSIAILYCMAVHNDGRPDTPAIEADRLLNLPMLDWDVKHVLPPVGAKLYAPRSGQQMASGPRPSKGTSWCALMAIHFRSHCSNNQCNKEPPPIIRPAIQCLSTTSSKQSLSLPPGESESKEMKQARLLPSIQNLIDEAINALSTSDCCHCKFTLEFNGFLQLPQLLVVNMNGRRVDTAIDEKYDDIPLLRISLPEGNAAVIYEAWSIIYNHDGHYTTEVKWNDNWWYYNGDEAKGVMYASSRPLFGPPGYSTGFVHSIATIIYKRRPDNREYPDHIADAQPYHPSAPPLPTSHSHFLP